MRARSIKATTATMLVAATAFGLGLWFASQASRPTVDHGARSAFVVAAQAAQSSVMGDINFLGINPEDHTIGRISVWAGMGAPSKDAGRPAESIESGPGVDPTEPSRTGVTLVIGGAAANEFAGCESNEDVRVWTDVQFDELSPTEGAGIVESIRVQLLDREAQYGVGRSPTAASALDTAKTFTFTVIEPIALQPAVWAMKGVLVSDGDSGEENTSLETRTVGHTAFFQCDVDFGALWTTQSWGTRFELPALVVASAVSESPTHIVGRVGVYRHKELASFRYSSADGLDDATNTQTWPGMEGKQVAEFAFRESEPVLDVPDISISYAATSSLPWQEASLFLAGAMFSVCASLLVAVLSQIKGRRMARAAVRASGP